MAPSCRIPDRERYTRMAIGSAFVIWGFLMSRDVLVRLTLVTVGSAMTTAAALGH